MEFYRARHHRLFIQYAAAIVPAVIGAQYLFPKTPVRHTNTIVMTDNRREVTDDNYNLFLGVSLSLKSNHAVLLVGVIYPTEALVFKLILIKCLFTGIKSIEIGDELLNALMNAVVEQVPVEAALVIPLRRLTEFATHKKQLGAGVCEHVAEQQTQIGKLLPFITGHFACQRSFAVYNFVVR